MSEGSDNDESTSTVLDGWTKKDKKNLLKSLQTHGALKIKEIENDLGNKTQRQILDALDYYRDRALRVKATRATKRLLTTRKPCINIQSTVPLANWANHLTDTYEFKDLKTDTVKALRLIAEYDKIPNPGDTEYIDFRQIYHAIADAMEGKQLPDDTMINEVLYKCAFETAVISKSFIKPSVFNFVMSSMKDNKPKTINFIARPTVDHELACIRHLASKKNYNPLNLSEHNLKSSGVKDVY